MVVSSLRYNESLVKGTNAALGPKVVILHRRLDGESIHPEYTNDIAFMSIHDRWLGTAWEKGERIVDARLRALASAGEE